MESKKQRMWAAGGLFVLLAIFLLLEFSYRAYLQLRYGGYRSATDALYLPKISGDSLPVRLRPGAEVKIGERRLSIGPDGIRSGLPVKPDSPLVLFVGGSSLFAADNSDEETPTARTQAALFSLLGREIRAANGGVPGYTARDARLWAEELFSRLSPRAVVLVEAYNDAKRVAFLPLGQGGTYEEWRRWSEAYWEVPPWWRRSDVIDRFFRRPRADWGFVGRGDGTITKVPEDFEAAYLKEIQALEASSVSRGTLFVYAVQPFNVNSKEEPATPGARAAVAMNLWPLAPVTGAWVVRELSKRALADRPSALNVDFSTEFVEHPEFFVDHVHLSKEGARRWGEKMAEGLAGLPGVRERFLAP